MERQLATVRTIFDILPIENADFIELAKIDGWQYGGYEFTHYDTVVYYTDIFSSFKKWKLLNESN